MDTEFTKKYFSFAIPPFLSVERGIPPKRKYFLLQSISLAGSCICSKAFWRFPGVFLSFLDV